MECFEKGKILMTFSGLTPSKQNILSKKLRVGYAYVEESFDTIFKMGYVGGGGSCNGKIAHGRKG